MANEMRESNNNLTVKVGVDVADAITGLKAVQREAKEAARALKELENIQGYDLANGNDYTAVKKVKQPHWRLLICGANRHQEEDMKKELSERIPAHKMFLNSYYSTHHGFRYDNVVVVVAETREHHEILSEKQVADFKQKGAVVIGFEDFKALNGAMRNLTNLIYY